MDNGVTPDLFRDVPGVPLGAGVGLGFPRLELKPEFPTSPVTFFAVIF